MNTENNSQTDAIKSPEVKVTNGPILVLLAVIMMIILGGMYYWYTTIDNALIPNQASYTRPTAEENNEPESTTAEAQADAMGVVSTSDEINAIEADLESTDLDTLDAELQAIENELNSI
jgi:uncharacterized protein HemX